MFGMVIVGSRFGGKFWLGGRKTVVVPFQQKIEVSLMLWFSC